MDARKRAYGRQDGGMSGTRTRTSRLQGGGSAQLSYHPIRNGAWSWFRANLSASSARRCHQISFPGVVNWRGRGESNSFRRSGAPALNQSTTSACPAFARRVDRVVEDQDWGKVKESNLRP